MFKGYFDNLLLAFRVKRQDWNQDAGSQFIETFSPGGDGLWRGSNLERCSPAPRPFLSPLLSLPEDSFPV
jgi:hypothetical protein